MNALTRVPLPMLDVGSYPNILQFGGVDDGTATDDTAAFNAMAAYCNAAGLPGYVPPAKLGFSTNGGHSFKYGLIGAGGWRSKLIITHPTNDIITGSDFYGGNYDGIYYFASVARTAGRTIAIDTPSMSNALGASIRYNKFQNGYNDIHLIRANVTSVEGNQSVDFQRHFLILENRDFPDNGDYSIIGNVWDTSAAGAQAGILQYSAGGARILNNKGGRGTFGYQLELGGPEAASTSILIMKGNSFEGQTVGQVRLGRQDGSLAQFLHVIIDGNEFAGAPAGNAAIELDSGDDFISNVIFTSNVVQFTGTALAVSTCKAIMIASNVFQAFGGASVGISSSGTATGNIGLNTYLNVTTPVSNSAAGVTVL